MRAFSPLQLDWVAWLARGGGADASATTSPGPSHPHAAALASLRLVPEYALADALDWLTYILQASPLHPYMCAVHRTAAGEQSSTGTQQVQGS